MFLCRHKLKAELLFKFAAFSCIRCDQYLVAIFAIDGASPRDIYGPDISGYTDGMAVTALTFEQIMCLPSMVQYETLLQQEAVLRSTELPQNPLGATIGLWRP